TISSDISIDDFKFEDCAIQKQGHCEGYTDPYNCSNGNCIHQDSLCDYNDDCGDKSDENICDAYVEMCDFENNAQPLCSWSHDPGADFRWQRVRGEQINNNNWYDDFWQLYGPDRDHTLGTSKGYLLYFQGSTSRKLNDTARVVSTVFSPSTSGKCEFRFWYHMYGYDIGALNIYTRTYVDGPLNLLWSQKGNRGDVWLRRKVTLQSTDPFQVVIEGVHGQGYEGDIGIDDISFTPGCAVLSTQTLPPFIYSTTPMPGCNATHAYCLTDRTQCIPREQFCNFYIECKDKTDELSCPISCTFEQKTLCQWAHDTKQKLKWTFGNSDTSSTNTGPSFDHTTHSVNGTYIYLETSDGVNGDKARLISPLYRKSSKTCMFTFWYHMYGQTINTLNIFVRAGGVDTLVWSLQGNQGRDWLLGTAYLPTCVSQFHIVVEGIRGTSFTGDIALDDFRFEQCYEAPAPLPPTCPAGDTNQFMCASKYCIPQASKCDYEPDCCDGSDEEELVCYNYHRCDFEQDSCLWEPTSASELKWERYRVNALPFHHRPPYDHSTRSSNGHFYALRLNATTPRDTFASISTYMAPSSEQGCTMRFWVYFKSSNNGLLTVNYRYEIGADLMALPVSSYSSCPTNSSKCSWQRIDVALSSILTNATEIMIGVRTGVDRDAIMAIDDITFTPQCIKFNGTIPTRPPTTPYTGPSTTTTTTTSTSSTTDITGITTTTTYSGPATTTTTPSECAQFTCYNYGICKPSPTEVGKPVCECKPGFTGAQCETKEKPKKKSNLGAILGGIFGAIAAIALAIVGYIFILPRIRAARDNANTPLIGQPPLGPITNPLYNEAAASSDA
ncbi:unnamed protein product, partial [Adineta ricciae]